MIDISGKRLAGLARGVAMFKSVMNADARMGEAQDSPLKNAGMSKCRKCGAVIDLSFGADSPAEHEGAAGTESDPRSPGDRDDICDVCDYGQNRNALPKAKRACSLCGHTSGSTFSVTMGRLCSEIGCKCADPVHAANSLENTLTPDEKRKAWSFPPKCPDGHGPMNVVEKTGTGYRYECPTCKIRILDNADSASRSKCEWCGDFDAPKHRRTDGSIVYQCGKCAEKIPLSNAETFSPGDSVFIRDPHPKYAGKIGKIVRFAKGNEKMGEGDAYVIDTGEYESAIIPVRYVVRNASDPAIFEQLAQVNAEISRLEAIDKNSPEGLAPEKARALDRLRITKAGLEKALRKSDPPRKNAETECELCGAEANTKYAGTLTKHKRGDGTSMMLCKNCAIPEKLKREGFVNADPKKPLSQLRDELSMKIYGKSYHELPDDGPEQDHVMAEFEKWEDRGFENVVEYPHDILPNSKAGLIRGAKKYGETK